MNARTCAPGLAVRTRLIGLTVLTTLTALVIGLGASLAPGGEPLLVHRLFSFPSAGIIDVRVLGDVTGDGVLDVGALIEDRRRPITRYHVHIHSGVDGSLARVLSDPLQGGRVSAFSGVGDWNRDGHDDVGVVGSTLLLAGKPARIFSGKDGRLLHALSPRPVATWHVPVSAIDGGKDIDRDGVPDVVFGVPNWNEIVAYSGGTGQEIGRAAGEQLNDRFGTTVALAGDALGDGFGDIVVGTPYHGKGSSPPGAVYLISGLGLASNVRPKLALKLSPSSTTGAGGRIAVGDVNGDGIPDVVFDALDPVTRQRVVYCHSGRDGRPIHRITLSAAHSAASGLSAGDVNGDGRADIAVADSWTGRGRVSIFGGRFGLPVPIHEVRPDQGTSFGADLDLGRDLNGDGMHDLVVMSRAAPGSIHVVSAIALAGGASYGKTGRAPQTLALSLERVDSPRLAKDVRITIRGGAPNGWSHLGLAYAATERRLGGHTLLVDLRTAPVLPGAPLIPVRLDAAGEARIPCVDLLHLDPFARQFYLQAFQFGGRATASSAGLRIIVPRGE